MEKILLNFDEAGYSSKLLKINSAQKVIQGLVAGINKICNLKIDNKLLQDILLGKGEKTAAAIEQSVIADLDKAKINSVSIRNAAVKGDLEIYYSLLKSFVKPDNEFLQLLSINSDGQILINQKAKQEIEESCKSYITSEKGLKVNQAHIKFVDAINDFLKICPMFNSLNFLQAYSFKAGGEQVVANNLDYDRIANY